MIFALAALLLAATEPAMTDGEVWNEGVSFYRDGDVTNALKTLRPLLLSKTHGARAAEVVAKLESKRRRTRRRSRLGPHPRTRRRTATSRARSTACLQSARKSI